MAHKRRPNTTSEAIETTSYLSVLALLKSPIVPAAWEFLSIPVPDLKQNGDDGGKQAAEKDKEARILEMGDSLSNVQTPSRLLPT